MDGLEDILKTIGTVVFVAIYLFGGQLFKSKDENEAGPPNLPRPSRESEEASDEYAARQRQIQEAIRRKIMERRQGGTEAAAESPAVEPPQPVVVHREQRRELVERHKQTQQRTPHVEPTPEVVAPIPESDGRFSWDSSDNVYEQQMQERLQEIEATKRRAEALKRQTGTSAISTSKERRSRQRPARGGLLSGSVRSVLRDPDAARTAFVYGEVLGKPVGMRESGSGVE